MSYCLSVWKAIVTTISISLPDNYNICISSGLNSLYCCFSLWYLLSFHILGYFWPDARYHDFFLTIYFCISLQSFELCWNIIKLLRNIFILGDLPLEIIGKTRGVFNIVVVQLLTRIWPFATPWTAALQASPSLTIYRSLLKLTSIELVMPSNHPILLPFPSPLSPLLRQDPFDSLANVLMSFFILAGKNRQYSQPWVCSIHSFY